MAQPLSPAHPISKDTPPASKAVSMLVVLGAGVAGLAVVATVALWFHYGTQVFFEMIRTGFAACF
jgi:hypothetical protein